MQPTQPIVNPSVTSGNNTPKIFVEKSRVMLILVIVLFIILIVLASLIINTLIHKKTLTSELQNKQQSKSENTTQTGIQTPTNGYEVIDQKKDDKVGRTLVYKGRVKVDTDRRKVTEGIGWYELKSKENPDVSYKYGATGYFLGFEGVNNSADVYLKLKIPSEKEVIKVRVLQEPLPKLKGTSSESMLTWLTVEDLNVLVTDPKVERQGESYLGLMKFIIGQDRERLFVDYDVVSVIFLKTPKVFAPVVDEKNNVVAQGVVIRRFGGIKELEKELYHSIHNTETNPQI